MGRLFSLCLALNLAACCNPSELGERFSGSASPPSTSAPVASVAETTPNPDAVGASGKTPAPFAAGQWARYTITRGNTKSSMEFKIISKEGNAHWFEVVTKQSGKTTIVQILMAAKDRSDSKSYELKAAKVRLPNGTVQVLRGMQLRMTRKMLDGFLARLRIPEFNEGERQDTKVPAGTFKQCYIHEVSGTFFGIKTNSKLWNHSAVPISTMVRSIDRSDGAVTVLDAYGMTGAKSVMN